MKITGSTLQQYELPLARPLVIGSTRLTTRKGLVLTLQSDDGLCGYGEIAPLPGLQKETLSEAAQQLKRCCGKLNGLSIEPSMLLFDGSMTQWLPPESCPTVRLGVEMAIFDLLVQAFSVSCELPKSIPINALLMADSEKSLAQVDDLLSQGFTSIKLKVARQPLAKDIEDVTAILSRLRGRALLRLDANRCWTLDQAKQFCKAIDPDGIEYIEEPTQNPADHVHLEEIPIALDETLAEMSCEQIKPDRYTAAIIKPGVLGGFEAGAAVIRWAREHRLTPVISSGFESLLTTRMYLVFAAMMGIMDIPLGLDTGKWFQQDLLTEPLAFEKGRMHLPALSMRPVLRQDCLRPLEEK